LNNILHIPFKYFTIYHEYQKMNKRRKQWREKEKKEERRRGGERKKSK
jgi:hypothetical protein